MNISISTSVLDKISHDKILFYPIKGENIVPLLEYVSDLFYKIEDGSEFHEGQGFHISFVQPEAATDDTIFTYTSEDNRTVFIAANKVLEQGHHLIDLIDGQIRLAT